MQDKIEYLLFRAFSAIFCAAGMKIARKIGAGIGLFFFYVIPIRKEVVLKNLRMAFPEKSEDDVRLLARANYRNFGIVLAEILLLPSMSADDMRAQVAGDNAGGVREIFAEGKGMILMTAHFGNWEWAALGAALQVGIPFTMVTKEQRNEYVSRWMDRYRARWGNTTVSLGVSIRVIFSELKQKRIVALVADQRGPADGTRVNFFGISSSVYTGPAVLALKTNAPILYGVVVRNSDGTYRFKMERVSTENLPADHEEAVRELSQRHTAILERFAKEHPEQWFWMHNRWKY